VFDPRWPALMELLLAVWRGSPLRSQQAIPITKGTGSPFFSFLSPHRGNYFLSVMWVGWAFIRIAMQCIRQVQVKHGWD
jgi:hypothetical protein